jgi:addiction module HigA family antidote
MGITQQQLADAIYVPFQRINELINGKRGVTPSTSLRLALFFGVSEDFWINLQARWDLYKTKKKEQKTLEKIVPTKIKSVSK